MKVYTLSDEEIKEAFEGTSFGTSLTQKERLYKGLLKSTCGYYNGFTMTSILKYLSLITQKKGNPTKKGKYLLYEYFKTKD